jgi:hypothetical protein
MYWTEEAQTRTETEPQFKMMELKAHELSGYSVSSNVLLADAAFGLEKFLMTLFGQAIAWFEEYAFLQGNGVGKPQGMLAAACAATVNRNAGNQVQFVDLATMWSKLLPASWNNAIWVFSPSVVPQLLQLKDGANRAIFISIDQGAAKAPNWNLLGRPAIPTEKLPALGTKGDLMLVDPSFYVIGDRMQIEIAASEHVNFLKCRFPWGRSKTISAACARRCTCALSPFACTARSSAGQAAAPVVVEQDLAPAEFLFEDLVFAAQVVDELLLPLIDPARQDDCEKLPGLQNKVHAQADEVRDETAPASVIDQAPSTG